MIVFKVKYLVTPERAPSHVYCRLYVAPQADRLYVAPQPDQAYASLGTFTMRLHEFEAFKTAFTGATFEEIE